MHIAITTATAIVLTLNDGPLDIEIADDADEDVGFSPLHMLAAALATCTASVLSAYAETARLDSDNAQIIVEWDYVDDPHRVGAYRMDIRWPTELPEGRRKALCRAAEQCTVHATLSHSPTITTTVGA